MKKTFKISRKEPGAGFFSNWFWLLGYVCMFDARGQEVCIDTKSQKNLYNSKNIFRIRKSGYWDELFEVQKKHSSFDVQLVTDSYPSAYVPKRISGEDIVFNKKDLVIFRKAIKSHGLFKKNIYKNIYFEYSKIDFTKTLGVHYRAADKNIQRSDHKMNQSLDDYIEKAGELMKKNKYEKLFLATDNCYALEKFQQAFPKALIFSHSNRIKGQYAKRGIHDSRFNKFLGYLTEVNIQNAYEVIEDALILSRCDSMLCGYSNVSDAAICIKEKSFNDLILVGNGRIIFE
jgi:hypothetical protein